MSLLNRINWNFILAILAGIALWAAAIGATVVAISCGIWMVH